MKAQLFIVFIKDACPVAETLPAAVQYVRRCRRRAMSTTAETTPDGKNHIHDIFTSCLSEFIYAKQSSNCKLKIIYFLLVGLKPKGRGTLYVSDGLSKEILVRCVVGGEFKLNYFLIPHVERRFSWSWYSLVIGLFM